MTLPDLLEWVQKLGAAAGPIFALLWWLERGERKEAQTELRDIAKDSVIAITKTEGTISRWVDIFKPGNPHS